MMMLKMTLMPLIYRKGSKESCHQKRKEEYWSCTYRCRSVKIKIQIHLLWSDLEMQNTFFLALLIRACAVIVPIIPAILSTWKIVGQSQYPRQLWFKTKSRTHCFRNFPDGQIEIRYYFCSDTSSRQIETEEWFSFCIFNCLPVQFYSIWGNIRFCFCPPADILAPYFAVQMYCSRWKMIYFVFCSCVLVFPCPYLQRVMMGYDMFCFLICLCRVLCFDICCVLSFARVCWSVHTCRERWWGCVAKSLMIDARADFTHGLSWSWWWWSSWQCWWQWRDDYNGVGDNDDNDHKDVNHS